MNFKLGDTVLVLDEDLAGVIKNISNNLITIETVEGFLLDFSSNELLLDKKESIDSISPNVIELRSFISEKEDIPKRKQVKRKAKEKYLPTIEVDLHIHHLVKSSRGMSNHDMLTLQLNTARRQLDFAIKKRIQKIVFIHGVGEGVLKMELDYLFGRYNNVKFYDADYKKYGLGATEVYIFQNIQPNS